MIQTWKNIILDLQQPISYLIPAITVALLILIVYMVWKRKIISVSSVLLIVYGQVLLQTAFFSREPGSRSGVDLKLFSTWGYTAISHAFFIENIMMFIPLGILMPVVFKKMQKMQVCVCAGFLCTCGIECSQFITQRGFCQLDDVVTNTFGALAGWFIWKCGTIYSEAKFPKQKSKKLL